MSTKKTRFAIRSGGERRGRGPVKGPIVPLHPESVDYSNRVTKLARLLPVVLFASVTWGQAPETGGGRVWNIPALAYGPNLWSVLRVTNPSTSAASINVQVFAESGERLPVAADASVQPGETREIRIEQPAAAEESCWAKVYASDPRIQVEGRVESLKGNELVSYERQAKDPSANAVWVANSADIEGHQLYFINLRERPTVLMFCQTNRREQRTCQAKASPANRFVVNPNQSVAVEVKKLRQHFFIAESSSPARSILLLFSGAPGSTKVFSSHSSVEFGREE